MTLHSGDKFRLRFAKTGDLVFVSHLDLSRAFERMLRRGQIPVKMSNGFHPAPRIIFALSMSLGIVGSEEVVEIELSEPRPAEDFLAILREQAPPGLEFLSIQPVAMKASAVPRRMVYTAELTEAHRSIVVSHLAALPADGKLWVERHRPKPRRLNIRPYLRELSLRESTLWLDLWVTPTGTARLDELLRVLGIPDAIRDGTPLARRHLELIDETPADPPDGPPTAPAETAPLEHPSAEWAEETVSPTRPAFGMVPDEAVVE
ncbi:MAG: TIGR03936 family radical SAM-associated protein [Gemmataceae bacterium]